MAERRGCELELAASRHNFSENHKEELQIKIPRPGSELRGSDSSSHKRKGHEASLK